MTSSSQREREAVERAKAWRLKDTTVSEGVVCDALASAGDRINALQGYACGYLAAIDAAWNAAIEAALRACAEPVRGDEQYGRFRPHEIETVANRIRALRRAEGTK
jgi:hypothetical protein